MARYHNLELEELIWKAQENSVEFSQLARRHIISALSALPDPWGQIGAQEFLSGIFPLGSSLSKAVLPRSDLENIRDTYKQLNLLHISERRLRAFLEKLVDPNIRNKEDQNKYVGTLNPILKQCGWELQATTEDMGRLFYSMHRIQQGVQGRPKNIIFASRIRPDLRFVDAINNDIEIVTHKDKVLVYDRPIPQAGLLWQNLQEWWADQCGLDPKSRETTVHLYQRLYESLPENSPPQRLFFTTYFKEHKDSFVNLPALLPEVWLHYDLQTIAQRGRDALLRQRMDFLMLFSHAERIVFEVDGAQHYSDNGVANPSKYARMAAADRELRLSGYHVYRFGGSELQGPKGEETIRRFFHALFRRHGQK
ncbi:hypothetical protein D187_002173 [Cystobacter fuscus DSM 2262]|uniref:AbiJ-NTD3 domain-containing protein n=1 Tax=Cystobacter fuscus (strain ATCC 25194 / DSM 2262 / NBRC 100088 / M29) TaxID=1242864 RepID=S9PCT1_CYSF2|nr:hypothetical protein D187_002173 [Cystobacter fuscus DSM 2262]